MVTIISYIGLLSAVLVGSIVIYLGLVKIELI